MKLELVKRNDDFAQKNKTASKRNIKESTYDIGLSNSCFAFIYFSREKR